MKSRQFIVDIIEILVVLPLLLVNIVPALAQNYYSEVIHTSGSECLVYSIESANFYLNVSATYSIYDNRSIVKQEYPMWIVHTSNDSQITIIYRVCIADISNNNTTFYDKVYNTSYGKYVMVEFSNGVTSLSIYDDNRNLVESYQEMVDGNLESIYARGFNITRLDVPCSEFFSGVDSLGGIAENDNIMIYLALAYTPMVVVLLYSLYFFAKKKIIIRRIHKTK